MSTYPAGKLPHAELRRLLAAYTHHHEHLLVPPTLGEDAAVIEFGDRLLVAKTDPITFATDQIGWYAVHVNANDIAAMGAVPRFFLSTILLPAGQATPALTESIFRSIYEAATSLDIVVCGGHSEITHGIDRALVIGQMFGETTRDKLVRSSGLEPGHALILTKGIGIEATAIIAQEKRGELLARGYDSETLTTCAAFLHTPGISVVQDANIATGAGRVTAMHDPTEGGVATGLYELATASNVGIEIDHDALFVAPETTRLCAEFALDPLGVISSGALLIGCESASAAAILTALKTNDIAAARIGTVHEPSFGLQLNRNGHISPLPTFATDEITRLFT